MDMERHAYDKLVEGKRVFDKEKACAEWERGVVVVNGIPRWKSNDRIPPKECLADFQLAGFDFDIERALNTSKKETGAFLDAYRKQMENYTPSPEELFEMRANFDEGTTVVNVITGKKIKL